MIRLSQYISGTKAKSLTGYNYFVPTKVNDKWSWDDIELNQLLEATAIKLGELNTYSKLAPNVNQFISLHIKNEAVLSSRIEGTNTRIDEALMEESEIEPERLEDWREVQNYSRALNEAIQSLDVLPISTRLIKKTHKTLLAGVRGQNKLPGEYRISQNWIGGQNLSSAAFVPPHPDLVYDYMSDLEFFIHNGEISIPHLVKVAIVHYQFETIHPFLDGNGRIGRLLIPLMLMERGLLSKPLLNISSYFERNRGLYYDRLTAVRENHKMREWILYFLHGVYEMSVKSSSTLSKMLALQSDLEDRIRAEFGRRAKSALILLEYLFTSPYVNIKKVKEVTGLSFNAANALVMEFLVAGILTETTGFNRNRVFWFKDYLQLLF